MGSPPWWRGCVVYQVYVRSFCDSDGDGHGDLDGVRARLDYIAALGVDAIWLSPIHPSPNRDWGYDISDYDAVARDYGGMAAFDRLLDAAHARGIRVLLDEVLAHTSDEHPWFRESEARGETSDWYIWADAGADGGPPNNWRSSFGGPAWTWSGVRGQYFHHKFMPQQPKLNWLSEGGRRAALEVLDRWLAKGVDGFRLDVAGALVHDPSLADNPEGLEGQRHLNDANRPENLDVLDQVRQLVERYDGRFVLGEFFEEPELAGAYAAPDEGVHSAYTFPLLLNEELGPEFIRDHFAELARYPKHWPSVAFSNHDVARVRTRLGGPDAPRAVADLMLALLIALKGTVLLYQGEELGLPHAEVAPDRRRDPIRDVNRLDAGRDGARTPMPWTDGSNLGFSTGEPWLPAAPEHAPLSVAAQEANPGSTLHLARRLIVLRKACAPLRLGEISFLQTAGPLLAFERSLGADRILCVFNLGGGEAELTADLAGGETLIESPVGAGGPFGFRLARLQP